MGRAKDIVSKIGEAKATVSGKRISQAIELSRKAENDHWQYTYVIKPLSKDKFEFTVTPISGTSSEAKKILKDILLDAGYPESEVKVS